MPPTEVMELNALNPDELEQPEPKRKPEPEEDEKPPLRGRRKRKGKLLELKERAAAEAAAKLFFSEAQKLAMSKNNAQWTVNELRRRGVPGVGVVMTSNGSYDYHIPSVVSPDSTPAPNKSARLCRRTTAVLFSDPPAPEVEPGSGEADDVEAAELEGRILEDLDSETQLNELAAYRRAFNKTHSYGSGFIHYMVNPRGGGYVPIELDAHPDAETVDDALEYTPMQPVMMPHPAGLVDATGAPQMVPATDENGEPVEEPQTDEMGEPVRVPWPEEELVTRYATVNSGLTDDKGDPEVAYRWSPRLEREIITGRNFRFIPHDCEDIWDARGGQIAKFKTWGWVKERWPKYAEWDDTDEGRKKRDALFSYRPEDCKWLVPANERAALGVDEKNADENLVLILTTYYVMGEEYGQGCVMVSLADKEVAYRDTWCWEKEDGTVVKLDLPLSQVCGLDEGEDNPYKIGLMQTLGPMDEARRMIWGHALDHLDRIAHRQTFLPLHSNLQPEDLQSPTQTVYRILPGAEPRYQEIPDFPRFGTEMWINMGNEEDDESGLQQIGQGLENPNVQSGRHAYAIISQVLAGLSEFKQNVERAVRRGWRIKLQLVGAFYDVPQKTKWAGPDKEYQVKAWIGSDLSSDRDVKIRAGTFTQLTSAAKAQLAERLYTLRVLDQPHFNKAMRENLGGMLAMQDDEHRVRIKRQLSGFAEGPKKGEQPPPPPVDPTTGLPQIDPMTGQPAQPPLHPDLVRIFESVPADELLDVAQIRLQEMADFMATKRYLELPQWWRQGLDYEFGRMRAVLSQPAQQVPQRAPELTDSKGAAEPSAPENAPPNPAQQAAMAESGGGGGEQ